MKNALTAALLDEIQSGVDRATRKYQAGFSMRVRGLRAGDGVFQIEVAPTRQGIHSVRMVPILSMVEQDLEDRFPGLRVMLLPVEPGRTLVRRLGGVVKGTSRTGSAKKKSS